MARLVVLRFAYNDDAERFIREHVAKNAELRQDIEDVDANDAADARGDVVGLFAQPTKYCDSSDGHLKRAGRVGRTYVRGLTYGWWVCSKCKKPTRAWSEHIPGVIHSGYNLLKVFLEGLDEDGLQKEKAAQAAMHNREVMVPVEGSPRGVKLYGG